LSNGRYSEYIIVLNKEVAMAFVSKKDLIEKLRPLVDRLDRLYDELDSLGDELERIKDEIEGELDGAEE
jgi:uncharacterized membrane protein